MTENEIIRALDLLEKYGDAAVVFTAIFGAVFLIIFCGDLRDHTERVLEE